jgi:hypothetical protein
MNRVKRARRIRRNPGVRRLALILAAMWSTLACAQSESSLSHLEFQSSNAELNASFQWAKHQALAYVRPGTGGIGPWYEAALPGRNAFCMRDVSHQTEGAAALGLFAANRNMLNRFAASVAPSRNWAGYWEIDENGRPSAADYRSDDDFWFNLPANFDALDAIVRMWRWTGDDFYRNDPDMQRFFAKTMSEYMTEWQLQPETILTRPRIANRRLEKGKFVDARGIPSYSEGPKNFIVGADLLAAEYRAIHSYQEIASSLADKQLSVHLVETADALQHILENVAWSSEKGHYSGLIQQGMKGSGSADTMVLYFGAAKDPVHIRGALDYVSSSSYWKTINIEEESYVPIVLFRHGRAGVAYQVLFDLSAPAKRRREYPEVSYAVIAGVVSGAMGIEPADLEPANPSKEFDLQTLAQPMTEKDELSLRSLRIKGNVIDVSHSGNATTRLTNKEGLPIRWKAMFQGPDQELVVDGKRIRAEHGSTAGGVQVSWVIVNVPARGTSIVSRVERALAERPKPGLSTALLH